MRLYREKLVYDKSSGLRIIVGNINSGGVSEGSRVYIYTEG